jgi:hypothetical protein
MQMLAKLVSIEFADGLGQNASTVLRGKVSPVSQSPKVKGLHLQCSTLVRLCIPYSDYDTGYGPVPGCEGRPCRLAGSCPTSNRQRVRMG